MLRFMAIRACHCHNSHLRNSSSRASCNSSNSSRTYNSNSCSWNSNNNSNTSNKTTSEATESAFLVHAIHVANERPSAMVARRVVSARRLASCACSRRPRDPGARDALTSPCCLPHRPMTSMPIPLPIPMPLAPLLLQAQRCHLQLHNNHSIETLLPHSPRCRPHHLRSPRQHSTTTTIITININNPLYPHRYRHLTYHLSLLLLMTHQLVRFPTLTIDSVAFLATTSTKQPPPLPMMMMMTMMTMVTTAWAQTTAAAAVVVVIRLTLMINAMIRTVTLDRCHRPRPPSPHPHRRRVPSRLHNRPLRRANLKHSRNLTPTLTLNNPHHPRRQQFETSTTS